MARKMEVEKKEHKKNNARVNPKKSQKANPKG